LDTALKHRLTGTVILVFLAVLLLPELLTGSGEVAKARLAIPNNSGDGERRFEVDLTESASAPALALPQQPQSQPAAEVPIGLSVPATILPSPAATPAPAIAAVPEERMLTPAPTPTPKTEPKPAAKSLGSYYVQVGIFVNAASARRLERQLRDKKFGVVVDQLNRSGKEMFRVRVGPEANRAAANALAKKLTDAGHTGSIVK